MGAQELFHGVIELAAVVAVCSAAVFAVVALILISIIFLPGVLLPGLAPGEFTWSAVMGILAAILTAVLDNSIARWCLWIFGAVIAASCVITLWQVASW